jgi:malonate transporter and related proteins
VTGVLQGFLVIVTIVAVGYAVGRAKLLSAHAERDLSRLIVSVMMPCLLISILAEADLARLFSSLFVILLIVALANMTLFAAIAMLAWRRKMPESVIGALSAGFCNAGNIGIPLSVYVLGDAAFTVPLILLQLALITPAALVVLDATAAKEARSLRRSLLMSLVNPMLIATAVGMLVAGLRISIPNFVMEPFRLIGVASVPLILLTFGMSLKNVRLLAPGRRDVIVASLFKLVLMPALAWMLGRFVFRVSAFDLLVVTLFAALPTAQNIYAIAQRYSRALAVARDTVLITTVGSIPVLLLVAATLSA